MVLLYMYATTIRFGIRLKNLSFYNKVETKQKDVHSLLMQENDRKTRNVKKMK